MLRVEVGARIHICPYFISHCRLHQEWPHHTYICDVIPDAGRMAHLAHICNATSQMAFAMSSGLVVYESKDSICGTKVDRTTHFYSS